MRFDPRGSGRLVPLGCFAALLGCGSASDAGLTGAGSADAGDGAGGTAGSGTGGSSAGTAGSGASAGSGAVAGSGATGGSGGSGAAPSDPLCQAACEKQAAAQCPNEDDAACVADCNAELGLARPSCGPQIDAFGACVTGPATVVCDADGKAQFTGCDPQLQAYARCTACLALQSDEPCESCQKSSCCQQRKDFFGDPQLLPFIHCIDACQDPACVTGCTQQFPGAGSLYQALGQCIGSACQSQCAG
jgi:hypothetical protein